VHSQASEQRIPSLGSGWRWFGEEERSIGWLGQFLEVVAGLDHHAQHVGVGAILGEVGAQLRGCAGNGAGEVGG